MVSRTPTVRQVAWISIIPQLLLMALLIFSFYLLGSGDPVLHGALIYLGLSFALRTFIPRDHRRGMQFVRQQRFEEAITCFEQSYEFFYRHAWIDRYRFLTLLSSSRISFREMALCNIAFCYTQIGNGETAIVYYKKVLNEFPESGLAHAALKMLQAADS